MLNPMWSMTLANLNQSIAKLNSNWLWIEIKSIALVDIKNQVQNKLCPKISQPLLTIHKYSVVHVGMVVVIIELPNISKQI